MNPGINDTPHCESGNNKTIQNYSMTKTRAQKLRSALNVAADVSKMSLTGPLDLAVSKAIGRITGQGGYYSDTVQPFLKKAIPKGTFATIGSRAGGVLGSASKIKGMGTAGSQMGKALGGRLAQIVGFGDYTVKTNNLATVGFAVPEGEAVPQFIGNGHETSVRHREFIKDIVIPGAPAAFTNQTFRINPADAVTFPWLAAVAAEYQQYRFNGLVFEFKTMSSDITGGGALGTVVLATEYDVVDVPFASKIAMENSEYAVSTKPSCSVIHAVECDPKLTSLKFLYTRESTLGLATSDSRFYDLGNFQIATTGLPGAAGTVLGELWVSYDVTLIKPQIATPFGFASGTTHVASVGGLTSNTVPLASGAVTGVGNVVQQSSASVKFIVGGTYLMTIAWAGTGLAVPSFSGPTTTVFAASGPHPGTLVSDVCNVRVTAVAGDELIFNFTASTTVTTVILNFVGLNGFGVLG